MNTITYLIDGKNLSQDDTKRLFANSKLGKRETVALEFATNIKQDATMNILGINIVRKVEDFSK